MCSWLFHMKVPTRWSPETPSDRSPWASRAALAATSANVARRLPAPSPSAGPTVTTVPSGKTCWPWRTIDAIDSGTSCMVLCTMASGHDELIGCAGIVL
jgi:hypothetical protein